VFGDVLPERLYYCVCESHFVVNAVVGNCLLERLRYDYTRPIILAFVVFPCHMPQQEVVWALLRTVVTCGYVVKVLCAYVSVRVSV
jgi:hypothetical protein